MADHGASLDGLEEKELVSAAALYVVCVCVVCGYGMVWLCFLFHPFICSRERVHVLDGDRRIQLGFRVALFRSLLAKVCLRISS
jgi:hypothetical protein